MAVLTTNGVTTALMDGTSGAAMARAVRTGAQPVSVQSVPVKIARIPDGGGLDITKVPVQFSQDLADTLGNIGTPTDGWESLLADMELSIGKDAAGLDDVITSLGDITDIDFGAFQSGVFDPVSTDLATFQTAGDKLIAQYTTDNSPPKPPPPPGGGKGGGKGGGGGGGGGGIGWCQFLHKPHDPGPICEP